MVPPGHISPDLDLGSITYSSQTTPISPSAWGDSLSQEHQTSSHPLSTGLQTSPTVAKEGALVGVSPLSVMSSSSRPASLPGYKPNTTKRMLDAPVTNATNVPEVLATAHAPQDNDSVVQMSQASDKDASSRPLESFCLIKEGIVSVEEVKELVKDYFEHYHPFHVGH